MSTNRVYEKQSRCRDARSADAAKKLRVFLMLVLLALGWHRVFVRIRNAWKRSPRRWEAVDMSSDPKAIPINIAGLVWSPYSPPEGTPECTCMFCKLQIGSAEPCEYEFCGGCERCEIAIRIFKPKCKQFPRGAEMRFHGSCFNLLIADAKGALAPR
jgi:ribosomal protein S21